MRTTWRQFTKLLNYPEAVVSMAQKLSCNFSLTFKCTKYKQFPITPSLHLTLVHEFITRREFSSRTKSLYDWITAA